MRILRALVKVAGITIVVFSSLYTYYLHAAATEVPSLSGRYNEYSIAVDGIKRSFSAYQPADLPESPALVFVLHGSRGSGDQMRALTAYEFDTLADQRGFVTIYPDGYKKHWNDCRASAEYAANVENIDDIAFISRMIEHFQRIVGADRDSVYVTGISNGGHMAYRLALEVPELVAAIAPIAANLPVDSNLGCTKSERPVPVAIFNGTQDPINPYQGGLVMLFGNSSRGTVLSSADTVRYWIGLAGGTMVVSTIDHPEVDGNLATSISEQRWQGNNGVEVRLYTLRGSGHVIPSQRADFPRFFGPPASDLSGPSEIVTFFLGTWAGGTANLTDLD